MDLKTQAYSTVNAEQSMQSASVIKAFIMAAVYDKLIYPDEGTTVSSDYESTLKPLLTSMITVSDNDSANELVRQLGGGDFQLELLLSIRSVRSGSIPPRISAASSWLLIQPMTITQVLPTAADCSLIFTTVLW